MNRSHRAIPGGDPTVALFLLHGRGGNPETILGKIPLLRIPASERPTLIVPEAEGGPFFSSPSWHAGPGVSGWAAWSESEDFRYLFELGMPYRYVAYCGHSGGAFMAQTMAALTGRQAITFAGTLARDFGAVVQSPKRGVDPRASCVNFVGTEEPFAPVEGKVRIGGWMNRQPSYKEQADKWSRHQTRMFEGGHEVPTTYLGRPIEQVVLRAFREEFLRRAR